MRFPIEMVIWDDAYSEDSWVSLKDIVDDIPRQRVCSVGWLVQETERTIFLAGNAPECEESKDGQEDYSLIMAIPKGMVVSRKRLQE